MGQKQTADPNGFTATNPLDRQTHMPGFRVNGGKFVKNRIAAQPAHVDQRSGDTDFLYFEVLISLL